MHGPPPKFFFVKVNSVSGELVFLSGVRQFLQITQSSVCQVQNLQIYHGAKNFFANSQFDSTERDFFCRQMCKCLRERLLFFSSSSS